VGVLEGAAGLRERAGIAVEALRRHEHPRLRVRVRWRRGRLPERIAT
jgi:hypothetical protein